MRTHDRPPPTDAQLDAMRRMADPHADDAVAAILGSCPVAPAECLADSAAAAACGDAVAGRLRCVDKLNAVIRGWRDNADVAAWRPDAAEVGPAMAAALERYVAVGRELPGWADPHRLERAQRMFVDHGVLSVTSLLCASLPECYVVPDLAEVLHATGQLEKRADYRIRATGAMLFPVMMIGGLTPGSPDGAGIAQILKVRLIHAMVRNLILRGPPAEARTVPPLAHIQTTDAMGPALHVLGWDVQARGLPNNQEELAYTLLTFNYVFLRAMRRLNIPLGAEECRDYIHAWNVAGHFLGVERELMADGMAGAASLFARMQVRGRERWAERPHGKDPRPQLGAALMGALQATLPGRTAKAFPVLITRRLVTRACVKDLCLDERTSWWARFVFAAGMALVGLVDAVARRLASPKFSIARLITRAVGYQLVCRLLMDETRPLAVPATLRPRIVAVIRRWGRDREASARMNAIEDRFTTEGDWEALEPPARR
jgi:ER-bound oxygenase mpaB/B'/Rubber oxygenase, catalytic domain